MSLNAGYLAPDRSFALLGVDRRHSSGPNCRLDAGGKLTHTPFGWTAGGGTMEGRILTIAQLTASVSYDGYPVSFGRTFAAAADRALEGLAANTVGLDGPGYVMIADAAEEGARLHQVSSDGKCWRSPPGRFGFSVLADTETEVVDALEERLSGTTDVREAVRRMCSGAVELTEDSPVVSPDLLIAAVLCGSESPQRVTWTGEARELAEASDAELGERSMPFRRPRPAPSREEILERGRQREVSA